MTFFNSPSVDEENLGNISGRSLVVIAGNLPNVPAGSTYYDICDFGSSISGGALSLPTETSGGVTLELVSDSASDTDNYLVVTLGTDYTTQVNTVTATGTTPVQIGAANSHFRPRAVRITTPRVTNRSNIGTITVRIPSGDTWMQIQPDFGVSQSTHYTVPAGVTAYTKFFRLWAPKDDDIIVRSRVTLYDATNPVELSVGAPFLYQNTSAYEIFASFPLAEKTDFKIQAQAPVTDGKIACTFDIREISNG